MKKLFLFAAMLMTMGHVVADEISVADIVVPKGGQADVVVCYQFNNADVFSGYNFTLVLPDGFTAVKKSGKEMLSTGECYTSTHTVSTNYVEETRENIYACFSTESEYLTGTNGVLLKITVVPDEALEIGDSFTAGVNNISLGKADGTSSKLSDFTFSITVGEPTDTHTVLDETSTIVPVAATGVDVRVKRTIKGGEWSTICLPFDMTAEQVSVAFGSDVQLAKFSSWSPVEDDGGAIVGINVGFETVTAIEANVPLIIKTAGDVSEFTVDGVDVNPDEAKLQVGKKSSERAFMYGNYVNGFKVPEENVFLSGGKFYYSVGNSPMMGYRGYFEFKDVLDAYYDVAPSRINIVIDGATTGIEMNRVTPANDRYYNLSGQPVDHPAKGLYISNGKKVVVK